MIIKLKNAPCPWCGGRARVNSNHNPSLFMFKAQVECTVCGAMSPAHYDKDSAKAAEMAIERWADMIDRNRLITDLEALGAGRTPTTQRVIEAAMLLVKAAPGCTKERRKHSEL